MQDIVSWWCDLIGITDNAAIQTATGVVGGMSLVLITLVVLVLILAVFAWVSEIVR